VFGGRTVRRRTHGIDVERCPFFFGVLFGLGEGEEVHLVAGGDVEQCAGVRRIVELTRIALRPYLLGMAAFCAELGKPASEMVR
jgi:hypothetical protein